jgi:pyruvate/2-oxoglutarate dehydrogenase complex dihydrolipoamide acyltransferase (E2) component
VGKLIALLAEEGDDVSNLEVPKEDSPEPKASEAKPEAAPPPPETKSAETSSEPNAHGRHPVHKRPLFPSVLRLLVDNSVSDADITKMKGTGVRGMLTKGDVLTFLGKASGPLGSFKPQAKETAAPVSATSEKKDAPKVRSLATPLEVTSNTLAVPRWTGYSHAHCQ